jgi:phage tail sheath protein FI
MAFNIGLNVLEVEGKTAPAIAGAPTSVASFIIRSPRGPTDMAVRVSNFQQFVTRFGGYHPDFVGAYCVDGFFLNGGQEAYIARVLGDKSTAASVTLKDRNGSDTLTVTAGYRGTPDRGAWGNDLYINIQDNPLFSTRLVSSLSGNRPARLLGNSLKTPVDLSSFSGKLPRILNLKIDSKEAISIHFDRLPVPGQASAQDIVDTIDKQLGQQVVASVKDGSILLIAKSKGTLSKIEIQRSIYEETLDKIKFGIVSAKSSSTGDQNPAQLVSQPLKGTIDVQDRTLEILLNGQHKSIDFNKLPSGDPTQASIQQVVDCINAQVKNFASVEDTGGDKIRLTSQHPGSIDLEQTDPATLNRLGFANSRAADGTGAQPATLLGGEITSPIQLGNPATLVLLVGKQSPKFLTIPLPQGMGVSVGDIVNAINNAQLSGNKLVTASVDANRIKLVSQDTGTKARIEIVIDDTLDLLGFPPNLRSAQGQGVASGTAYDQARVQSLAGLQKGDWVRLDDGITQNWHQIVDLRILNDAAGNPEYFVDWNSPSDQAEKNEYRTEDTTLSTCEFNLNIFWQRPTAPGPQLVESWSQLSLDRKHRNYAPLKVNDVFSGSSYIVLEDRVPGTYSGQDVPALGLSRLGLASATPDNLVRERGEDGDPPGIGDFKRALARFDTIAIQLLAIPEFMPDGQLKAVTTEALGYCENKGDCMFVGHTPLGRDAEGAKTFGQDFRASKVYGALYWPWIAVTDPIGTGSNPIKVIPPTGHVMGVYARIDQTRGLWKAPAGNEAVLRGALAVEKDITDVDHTDLVKNGSVNGIRRIPAAGIAIDASRTLSTDNRWLYVNVRLLFNYVKASLREGLRWVKQEPNRENLWNKIKYNTVTPFLQRLYQAGAFGPGAPEDVYTVVCGPENNPPDQIQLGYLKVEVYFYPARPAETIIIMVGQQDSGATAGER